MTFFLMPWILQAVLKGSVFTTPPCNIELHLLLCFHVTPSIGKVIALLQCLTHGVLSKRFFGVLSMYDSQGILFVQKIKSVCLIIASTLFSSLLCSQQSKPSFHKLLSQTILPRIQRRMQVSLQSITWRKLIM